MVYGSGLPYTRIRYYNKKKNMRERLKQLFYIFLKYNK